MRILVLKISVVLTLSMLLGFTVYVLPLPSAMKSTVHAHGSPTPAVVFDQAAELAKLRESIKGKESEPAEKVFKNIHSLRGLPARNVLAIMENGFSRSLGVTCTHCHTPGKWESEDKTQKQTARDMWAMVQSINNVSLKGIKNLKSSSPTVNCTTCHRGDIKPALNLPTSQRSGGD